LSHSGDRFEVFLRVIYILFFLDLLPLVPLIGYLFPASDRIAGWILMGNLKSQLEMFRRVRRGRRALKK
jgi:hypothetical protein